VNLQNSGPRLLTSALQAYRSLLQYNRRSLPIMATLNVICPSIFTDCMRIYNRVPNSTGVPKPDSPKR